MLMKYVNRDMSERPPHFAPVSALDIQSRRLHASSSRARVVSVPLIHAEYAKQKAVQMAAVKTNVGYQDKVR